MITAWPPTRYTPPLSADFPSLWDRYERPVQLIWKRGAGFELDHFQCQLLRHMLEQYPEGHEREGQLRFRETLTSMGRQNGKTEIETALCLVFLLMKPTAHVMGLAYRVKQANILYSRAKNMIDRNAGLKKRFRRSTETRGLKTLTGGEYTVNVAKTDALQGYDLDLLMADEVHLLESAVWTAGLNGLGGRPNGMVSGITTAGSPGSELLIELYKRIEVAIEADPDTNRLGGWIWEAPDDIVPADDELFYEKLCMANPAIASGRIDKATAISDARAMPIADLLRYKFNRFTEDTDNFISLGKFMACAAPNSWSFPTGRPVLSIDRVPDNGAATIVRSIKGPDGKIHAELVWSKVRPSHSLLIDAVLRLNKATNARAIVIDSYGNNAIVKDLKLKGLTVQTAGLGDQINGASLLYEKVANQQLVHNDLSGELMRQVPQAKRKDTKGGGYRLSRADSSTEIDAVVALALAIYTTETLPVQQLQIF